MEKELRVQELSRKLMNHLTEDFLVPAVVDFWMTAVKDISVPLSASFYYRTEQAETGEVYTTVYAEYEVDHKTDRVMLLHFSAHKSGIEIYREMHRVGAEACVQATIIREREKGSLESTHRGCEDEADIFD